MVETPGRGDPHRRGPSLQSAGPAGIVDPGWVVSYVPAGWAVSAPPCGAPGGWGAGGDPMGVWGIWGMGWLGDWGDFV